jgi:outer membrane receptor for monomeric catechols
LKCCNCFLWAIENIKLSKLKQITFFKDRFKAVYFHNRLFTLYHITILMNTSLKYWSNGTQVIEGETVLTYGISVTMTWIRFSVSKEEECRVYRSVNGNIDHHASVPKNNKHGLMWSYYEVWKYIVIGYGSFVESIWTYH